ncbi:hypothetical protein WA158_006025 [Blastocystis sp. Blastoise]
MVRDEKKEKQMSKYSFVEKGYVVFHGNNGKFCGISIEKLENFWYDSGFYHLWLDNPNPDKNGLCIVQNDRNIDLIIEHMNGKPINIDLKSKKELEELKEDFEYYMVKAPDNLLKRLNDFSAENIDSNGIIDDVICTKNGINEMNGKMGTVTGILTKFNENLNTMSVGIEQGNQNDVQLGRAFDEQKSDVKKLSSDIDELKTIVMKQNGVIDELKNIVIKQNDDNNQLKNIVLKQNDDSNQLKNIVLKQNDDNNQLKNIVLKQNDAIYQMKSDLKFIKDAADKSFVSKESLDQAIENIQQVKESVNKLADDHKKLKENDNKAAVDIKIMKDNMNKMADDNKEVKCGMNKVVDDIKQVKESMNKMANDNKEEKESLNQVANDNRESVNQVIEDIKEVKKSMNKMADDNKEVKDNMNKLANDNRESVNQVIENIKEVKDNMTKLADDNKEEKENINEVIEDIKEVKESMTKLADDNRESVNQVIEDTKEIKDNMNKMANDNKEEKENMNKVIEDIKEIKDNMNKLANDNKEMKESLNQVANDNREKMNKAIEDIQQVKKNVNKLANDNKEVKESINKLANDNKEMKESMNKMANDNKQLKDNMNKMANDNKEIKENMNKVIEDIKEVKESMNKLADDNKPMKYDTNYINEKIEEHTLDYQQRYSNDLPILEDSNTKNSTHDQVRDIVDKINNTEKNISSNKTEMNNSSKSSNLNTHNLINNLPNLYSSPVKANFADSVILKGYTSYINILNSWFGNKKPWKLSFRASEHKYKASEFHKYCDNKCPTVTIIKHIGHDDKINIFGGYTTQYWESRKEKEYKYDSGSFLFTLSNEHDIPPTKYDILDPFNALYWDKNHGPDFMDICIKDDCNNNNFSYINGHTCYYAHHNTPQSTSLFVNTAEPKENNYFTVEEYEVYELISNSNLNLQNSILINEETRIELNKWFKEDKEWELSYRCSDENRSVKKWHEKCDDKESLVIIQGKGEDGQSYIFGGYTSVGWGKNHSDMDNPLREGTGYRADSKAFLFSLTNPHGYNNTKLAVNPKKSSWALMSNDSEYELAFLNGIYLRTKTDDDQFINGSNEFLCDKNSVYIPPYPELGNSFFVNTNQPDKKNTFDLIDFEVFTSI